MKLIHKAITIGIASLLGLTAHAVDAQPTSKESTILISQTNTKGFNHSGGVGINRGSFYYPGGGSFNNGYLNNQGNGLYQGNFYHPGSGGISQGTFYYPNSGGNFHGLFYNPSTGGISQGNFYNPGPGGSNQAPYYNPSPRIIYPGTSYDLGLNCFGEPSAHDWGLGCFGQRDYRTAIGYYNEVIRRNPKFVDAYNKRALARFILGDKQGTIADLQKAANLYLAQGNKRKYQQTLDTIRDVQQDRTGNTRKK